ncbi:MAG: hypothetical protein H0T17_06045 [Propionibacteriales bacterium]|nr:hypothetical protein [Propionibacteriales bacterium]
MTERYLHADPPTPRQVAAVIDAVEVAISTIDLPLDEVRTAVGVAGTVLTMAAMVLDLPAYDRDVVNQAQLPSSAVLDAVDEIVAMSVKQRRALPFMHPDRADVIGAGALVLGCVVRRLGLSELRASSHDILDGIAWSLA